MPKSQVKRVGLLKGVCSPKNRAKTVGLLDVRTASASERIKNTSRTLRSRAKESASCASEQSERIKIPNQLSAEDLISSGTTTARIQIPAALLRHETDGEVASRE